MNNSTSNTARSSSFADESCWTKESQPVAYEFHVTEGDPMPAGTGFEASVFDDADNPIITCPVCGFTTPLMNGFTLNADESLDCGQCSARLD